MSILWASVAMTTALTVYNQNFAIVRETVPLDLKPGVNRVEFSGVTSQLEPESVLLRDPANGANSVVILEQSYRADPVSLNTLLNQNEGKIIDFQVRNGDRWEIIKGKIIRGGTMPHPPQPPVIEIDGRLRFDLPGTPLFPSLGEGTQLKPALAWSLQAARAGHIDAELSYSSGGFNWNADYNIVQSANNSLDIAGWVTLENSSGKTFENAGVKLMAGDVRKIKPAVPPGMAGRAIGGIVGGVPGGFPGAPQVTEKAFDEYHLYTLARPVTLFDKESKQVEFIRTSNIKSDLIYVYDGAKIDWNRVHMQPPDYLRQDTNFGSQSHSKVWVMREFVNSKANQLGMPLPKGKVRFYRRDTDGRLEFTGEDSIDHTPRDERIRVFTGAAFDLTGERRRTRFQIDHARSSADESFEIVVRNRKTEPVQVRIVEHMYRWTTWDIPVSSIPFTKRDAQTVEFTVQLAPGESKTVTYAAQYRW